MELDAWVDGYKVRAFPWIDGKNIYINVMYYAPGASISKPPAMDKSALVENNAEGQRLVYNFTSTCVAYITSLPIPTGGMARFSVDHAPVML